MTRWQLAVVLAVTVSTLLLWLSVVVADRVAGRSR